MPDINYWLGVKYGLQRRQADADMARARTAQYGAETARLGTAADANLTNVRAGLLPQQTAADIARINADIALTNQQTKYFGPTAEAGIRASDASAFANRQQGRLYGAQAEGETLLNQPPSFGFSAGMRAPTIDDIVSRYFSRRNLFGN